MPIEANDYVASPARCTDGRRRPWRRGGLRRAVPQATSAKLYGVALRILRSKEAAEDVVQDSFFKVWERARDFDPKLAGPVTWMVAIVRNRALDELRRRAARPSSDAAELDDLPGDDEHPIEAIGRREDFDRPLKCLERFGARQAPDGAARLSRRAQPGGAGEALRPAGRHDQDVAASQPRDVERVPRAMTELDDIDGLAGEYVLGTLTRAERAEVEERRATDAVLDKAIHAWERGWGRFQMSLHR